MQTPIVDYLNSVRDNLGQDAWKAEVRKLARQAVKLGGAHEQFWRDLTKDYDWINIDELKKEPDPVGPSLPGVPNFPGMPSMDQLMAQALKQHMPGIKTQAQFNTFKAALDAFRATMNAIFEGDKAKEAEGRKLLDMALTAAGQATVLSNQLADVPEAATSKDAEEFKKPPSEFTEYDVQRKLLAELETLKTDAELTEWYARTKDQRDSVRSQTLRNILMDAIRDRKVQFVSS